MSFFGYTADSTCGRGDARIRAYTSLFVGFTNDANLPLSHCLASDHDDDMMSAHDDRVMEASTQRMRVVR